MVVRLYTVSQDRKVVDKTIPNTYQEHSVVNKDNIDLLKPHFDFYYGTGAFNYNYLYCDNGYYYYIDRYIVLTGGRIRLECSIDIRKSLATYIKNSMSCTVLRNSKAPTQYHDNKLPIYPDKCIKKWNYLESPFTRSAIAYNIVVGVFNSQS